MQYLAGGYLGLYATLDAGPPPIPPGPPPPLVSALRDRLLSIAAVTDLVGTRIYTLEFPQSLTAPALRLVEIDRLSPMQLRGDVAIRRSRVQIDAVESDAHGDAYATAHALAAAVRGDLETGAPSGLVGLRGTLSGLTVTGILAADQRESYDAEARVVRIEQDFFVWFHA